jgi:hypothetical protein
MIGKTYSINDLIGTTYFANTDVGLTRAPYDGQAIVFNVKKGQAVGVIDTYFLPGNNRSNVWLGFLDANKRPYYVEIKPGQTNTSALQSQGVQTVEQKAEDQKTFLQNLPKYLGYTGLFFGLVYLGGKYIQSSKS